ncbi:SIS domain-containing protein [Roseibacterium sp. SDUM158017]|uniref:SIS domain-containing protein n=1 Tax=Roseicyclus salinarum TaxID=3036773 RepID=UPI0024159159|nr:SIS domain-containing protein [Roseibacterium sp. SDUM158017]MDG4650172.1 SIS domain-containing protein [Roseibacterium sp. SDUM158017]
MSIEQRINEIRRESSSDAAGDPERFRRVALTEKEMMAQGDAIRSTLAANVEPLAAIGRDLAGRTIRRVVTVGCGDSWIVGHGVRPAIEEALGAPCEPIEAFDFAAYGLHTINGETVVIGLSSSGKTEPVIEGLTASAAKGAYTVGLSNTLGSPLMEQSPGALHIRATRGGWPTQSSTAAMALMLAMAASVQKAKGGDASALEAALAALPEQVDSVARKFYDPAKAVAKHLARADLVLTTGAGPFFAPAEFGAAKLKELAPIHAYSFPLEEYHHYRTQKAGDAMFMVAADEASHARALETAIMSRGCDGYCVALVPEGETEISEIVDVAWHLPRVPAATAPIVYSVPLHLFGYHAAVERDALGLGAPRLGL